MCVVIPFILNVRRVDARAGVTQDFSCTFLLRCLTLFSLREGFRRPFPSSTVKSDFVYPRINRSPLVGHIFFYYVVRFPFRIVFFYLVTTGCMVIFYISLYWKSIKKSNRMLCAGKRLKLRQFVKNYTNLVYPSQNCPNTTQNFASFMGVGNRAQIFLSPSQEDTSQPDSPLYYLRYTVCYTRYSIVLYVI